MPWVVAIGARLALSRGLPSLYCPTYCISSMELTALEKPQASKSAMTWGHRVPSTLMEIGCESLPCISRMMSGEDEGLVGTLWKWLGGS